MDKQFYTAIIILIVLVLLLWYLGRNKTEYFSNIGDKPSNSWPITKAIVGEPPGVLAGVWKGDTLVHKIEYGYSDITKFTPMQWDMHGRIGSITKTFTCTVILILEDKGLLSIDHEARHYLPEIPAGITIRQLGNMTSGLYNYSLSENFNNELDTNPSKVWNINELAMSGINHTPMFEPGLGWSYSNTGLVLLGMIAERITGKTLEELYQTLIFDKLNLRNTSLPVPTDNTLPKPFFHGYMNGYNNDKKNITNVIRDVTNNNPSWAWAAGGIISNMDDLHIYTKALASGSLLSDKVKNIRNSNFTRISTSASYGFGLFLLNGEWYGHNGQIPGYQTFAINSPSRDITIVVMCNLFADSQGKEPADAIGKNLIEFVTKNNI